MADEDDYDPVGAALWRRTYEAARERDEAERKAEKEREKRESEENVAWLKALTEGRPA